MGWGELALWMASYRRLPRRMFCVSAARFLARPLLRGEAKQATVVPTLRLRFAFRRQPHRPPPERTLSHAQNRTTWDGLVRIN